jgi:hypothetical protein
MQPKHALLFALASLCLTQSKAQSSPTSDEPKGKTEKLNFIKVNLTSIALKNYSVQYERALNRKISFAVAFRTMPSSSLPFKNAIVDAVGDDDPDTKKTVETFKMSNFAITPEVRFYMSKKGYGRGFYIAPFYRYAKYKTNTLSFDYEGNSTSGTINLTGNLTTNTGGLLLGSQWALGKHLCLDWWILGPHYGSGSGEFVGTSSKPLTQEEQNDLRQSLEDLDIPLTDKTVSVNASGATFKLDGPWAGIRAGFSLGVRF